MIASHFLPRVRAIGLMLAVACCFSERAISQQKKSRRINNLLSLIFHGERAMSNL